MSTHEQPHEQPQEQNKERLKTSTIPSDSSEPPVNTSKNEDGTYNNVDGSTMLPSICDLLTAASSGSLDDFIDILEYPGCILTPDSADADGLTSIMLAIFNSNLPIARYCLNHTMNPASWVDKKGFTLLHFASLGDDVKTVRWVLEEAKVPVDATDCSGNTSLMHSMENGNMLTAEVLLKNGANPQAKNSKGESVADIVGLKNTTALELLNRHLGETKAASAKEVLGKLGPGGCEVCGVVDDKMFKCSRCKGPSYCSKNCQVADWKAIHKKECLPVKK